MLLIPINILLMVMITLMIIPVMMQRNAVKLLKGIHNLPTRRIQSGIKRYTLHLAGGNTETFIGSQVHAVTFLDISKVDGIDAAARVRDDGRLRVAE